MAKKVLPKKLHKNFHRFNNEGNVDGLPNLIEENNIDINGMFFKPDENSDYNHYLFFETSEREENNGKKSYFMNDYNHSKDYIFDEKNGAITRYTGASDKCEIPDCIEGIEVKEIGEKAFAECKDLVSVTIPETVTDIGTYAFSKCESLKIVQLPESLTVINRGVFAWCSFAKITIPGSVRKISEMAFAQCAELNEIDIPLSVNEIGPLAFSGCKKLVICCDEASAALNYARKKIIPYKICGTKDVIVTNHGPQIVTRLIDRKYKVTFVDDRVDQVSLDGKYEFINIDQFNTLKMRFVSDSELVDYLYDYGEKIPELAKIVMENCHRDVIHKTLSCSYLKRVKMIKITDSDSLNDLPEEICDYSSLEWLDLNRNGLKRLPEDFSRLESLKFLDISQNALCQLPQSIADLESLETLDASLNYLEELPAGFSGLSNLKELFLSSNEFDTIPSELIKMESLKVIRLQKNTISNSSDGCEELERKGGDISLNE